MSGLAKGDEVVTAGGIVGTDLEGRRRLREAAGLEQRRTAHSEECGRRDAAQRYAEVVGREVIRLPRHGTGAMSRLTDTLLGLSEGPARAPNTYSVGRYLAISGRDPHRAGLFAAEPVSAGLRVADPRRSGRCADDAGHRRQGDAGAGTRRHPYKGYAHGRQERRVAARQQRRSAARQRARSGGAAWRQRHRVAVRRRAEPRVDHAAVAAVARRASDVLRSRPLRRRAFPARSRHGKSDRRPDEERGGQHPSHPARGAAALRARERHGGRHAINRLVLRRVGARSGAGSDLQKEYRDFQILPRDVDGKPAL